MPLSNRKLRKPPETMCGLPAPAWQTTDAETVRLYNVDALHMSQYARDSSQKVQCIVTSPPYWGMRDYEAGSDEIGREATPFEYTRRLVELFRCLRKNWLRDDGVFWLNIGDCMAKADYRGSVYTPAADGVIKKGDVCGMPWMVANALRDDGWHLRSDNVWDKPDAMMESVTNRTMRSHEYVFMFTKRPDYYYDYVATLEKASTTSEHPSIKRSVWRVPHGGYEDAHYAVFPPALIEPCVKSGTSLAGCCDICGAPCLRVIEKEKVGRPRPNNYVKRQPGADSHVNTIGNTHSHTLRKTIGWEAGCKCHPGPLLMNSDDDRIWPFPGRKRCTVLDPFMGSGTAGEVALRYGCSFVGFELNKSYVTDHAIPRIDAVLNDDPRYRGLSPTVKPKPRKLDQD